MHSYLESTLKLFRYYKDLGDKSIGQLEEKELFWQYNPQSNSMAIIMRHMAGNMRSRFTDFLESDGEKEWRDRDSEFANAHPNRETLLADWDSGWNCLLSTLEKLEPTDLERIVYIRNEGHTVVEAINRQLAHYASHVGQMMFLAKMIRGENWQYLSIPPRQSGVYNAQKFAREKGRKHFTDGNSEN